MIDIQTVDHVAVRVGSIADAIELNISAQCFSLPVEADAQNHLTHHLTDA